MNRLKMQSDWHFQSPGKIPPEVVSCFRDVILGIASQSKSKIDIFEKFKRGFSPDCSISSSESYAMHDMTGIMNSASDNAPKFILNFWNVCCDISDESDGIELPTEDFINSFLESGGVFYRIIDGEVVSYHGQAPIKISFPEESISKKIHEYVKQELSQIDVHLNSKDIESALSGAIRLLESISHEFDGKKINDKEIKGDRFTKISEKMKNTKSHPIVQNFINHIECIYNFLSSAKRGGIRHGKKNHRKCRFVTQ